MKASGETSAAAPARGCRGAARRVAPEPGIGEGAQLPDGFNEVRKTIVQQFEQSGGRRSEEIC